MLKKFSLIAIFIFCFTAFLMAEDRPVAPNGEGPLILIDTNTDDPGFHWINPGGGYHIFARNAERAGFRLDQRFIYEITDEILEGVDIFILPIPDHSLSDSDKKAMRKFIRKGGSVLILGYGEEGFGFGELASVDTNAGVGVSPSFGDHANLDSFIRDYGITFGNRTNVANALVLDSSPFSMDIAADRVLFYGSFLEINPDKAMAGLLDENSGRVLLAYSTSGLLGKNYGKLVVSGSDTIFNNFSIMRVDNEEFALNLLRYLANEPDLELQNVRVKGRKPEPGDFFTVSVRVKNHGEATDGKVPVRFLLSDKEKFSDAADSDDLKVRKKAVASVPSGDYLTLTARFKASKELMSGDTIYVHVIVEDGVEKDPAHKKIVSKEIVLQ